MHVVSHGIILIIIIKDLCVQTPFICVNSLSITSGKAESSSLEGASPANSSATSSGHPSEVSSLDEHRVEEDQRYRQLLDSDKGEVLESEDTIILEDVPIVTPNKDVVATGEKKRPFCGVCNDLLGICGACACVCTVLILIETHPPCLHVLAPMNCNNLCMSSQLAADFSMMMAGQSRNVIHEGPGSRGSFQIMRS